MTLSTAALEEDLPFDPQEQSRQHFLFVHGGAHGAWCWFRIVTRLRKLGHRAVALDLAAGGVDKTDPNLVTSLEQWSQPFSDYLDSTDDSVILVAHSIGGGAATYLLEKYGPSRISKAIFVTALMPRDNQTYGESIPTESITRLKRIGFSKFLYANGSTSPTSVELNREVRDGIFYNKSPQEDITFAETLLQPFPYLPVYERLRLTPAKYGAIRRFYIKPLQDNLYIPIYADVIIANNPPEAVYTLDGSDHSPFFSVPHKLTNVLLAIANS